MPLIQGCAGPREVRNARFRKGVTKFVKIDKYRREYSLNLGKDEKGQKTTVLERSNSIY